MRRPQPSATPTLFKSTVELSAASLVRIHRSWRQIANARFAPARKEIAPAFFKQDLDWIFLIEVVGGGSDFRLGLAGERVVRFLGSEFEPGKLLSRIPSSPFNERSALVFRRCVTTMAPVALGPMRTLHGDRDFFDIEIVVLPLSDDAVSVTGLMGGVHLSPTSAVSAGSPS
jgi:hypothetical protein